VEAHEPLNYVFHHLNSQSRYVVKPEDGLKCVFRWSRMVLVRTLSSRRYKI